METDIEIVAACPENGPEIAEIHLAAHREAMPYLRRTRTNDETRAWFTGTVGDQTAAWWVARQDRRIVACTLLDGESLEHLYVRPDCQRHGIGRRLLAKAKALSPKRLTLSTFRKNTAARAFYLAHGLRITGCTDGLTEENEPDLQYVWVP